MRNFTTKTLESHKKLKNKIHRGKNCNYENTMKNFTERKNRLEEMMTVIELSTKIHKSDFKSL
jgi:hypothetical protein